MPYFMPLKYDLYAGKLIPLTFYSEVHRDCPVHGDIFRYSEGML
jgi:hypothetical protein